MKVDKVINNNLVRSHDDADREIMVMGRGLGFKKKPGDPIEREKIEKIYILQGGGAGPPHGRAALGNAAGMYPGNQ